jgi:ribosome maturation protein Sdo1
VVEKCVHPATKRRFTHENIRQAIKDIHFAVKTDQPAKKQALECIKLLQKRYKIVRGEMRVRVSFDQDKEEVLRAKLKEIDMI